MQKTPFPPSRANARSDRVKSDKGYSVMPTECDLPPNSDASQFSRPLQEHTLELQAQNDQLRRAQAELEATRAAYRELYDLAPFGYCTLDSAGHILQANLALATLLNISRENLVGQSLRCFVHPEDARLFDQCLGRSQNIAEAQSADLRISRQDDVVSWVRLTSAAANHPNVSQTFRVVLTDITERKLDEEGSQASSAYVRSLLEASLDPLVTISVDGTITDLNSATERAIGLTRLELIGSDFAQYFTNPGRARAAYQQVFSDGTVIDYPLVIRHASGSTMDVLYNASLYLDRQGKAVGVFAAARDVSERNRINEALTLQKEFFHRIAENIGDYIAVLDPSGRRIYASPSYLRFFGSMRDLRGSDSFTDVHPDDRERVMRAFSETVSSGIGRDLEYRLILDDGSVRTMESRGSVIKDSDGQVDRVVVVSRDVSERKHLENQVRQMAYHDLLTSLPNRRLLYDRLEQVMAASARSGYYGAMMFLDLDNFKPLNDKYGHEFGDLLLIEVAARLTNAVRSMDTVARFGGDEFVVMISELAKDKAESTSEAEAIAEKLRSRLAEPYELSVRHSDGTKEVVEHRGSASIGVVLFLNHQCSQDNVLRQADTAMYRAKELGRNNVLVVDPASDAGLP